MKGILAAMLYSARRQDGVRDYRFATYDVPGSIRTRLLSLNDCGQIVGDYSDAEGHNHGLLITDGIVTTIDVPGATSTTIHGLNNEGSLVGFWTDPGGEFHGFVCDDGRITTVDAPGAMGFSRLLGINSRGEIVGDYIDTDNVQHGFTLNRGLFTEFDFPGAQDTSPTAINADGVIVGGYTGGFPSGVRAFVFDHKSPRTVDIASAINAQPLGINSRADLVGTFDDAAGQSHGFAIIEDHFYPLHVPDSLFTTACGINSSRHIVGNFSHRGTHGFIAFPAAVRLHCDRRLKAARWFHLRRQPNLRPVLAQPDRRGGVACFA